MTGIIVTTPMAKRRRECAFGTSLVIGTLCFILVLGWIRFRVVGTIQPFQTAMNTSLGMTGIVVGTPVTQ
jgi:hypothetical protein